jgi:GNAT superfamily N-acetyltransferase
MAIGIRPLRPADRSQWQSLWIGYQEFYEADLSAQTQSLWLRLMDPPPDGPYGLIAETGSGTVCAFAHFLFHATTWSTAPRCYLNDLYTAQSARGQGAGRALIEAVYRAADAKGASQVYWLTQEFNAEARSLYDKVAKMTPFIKYAR